MIVISNLKKSYLNKNKVNIFNNLNLKIKKGDFIAIFGHNGIGKTTLLRVIAGLEEFQSGKITINQKPIKKATIGYIPQDYTRTLFPWYTIEKNLTLPLILSDHNDSHHQQKLRQIMNEFSIKLPLDEYPYNLSGGQQQMAVILRSIINSPDVLLMDEPFSSLDLKTAIDIQKKLLKIWKKRNLTILFVSHRIEEGINLSNKILILKGRPISIIESFNNPISFRDKFKIDKTASFSKFMTRIYMSIFS